MTNPGTRGAHSEPLRNLMDRMMKKYETMGFKTYRFPLVEVVDGGIWAGNPPSFEQPWVGTLHFEQGETDRGFWAHIAGVIGVPSQRSVFFLDTGDHMNGNPEYEEMWNKVKMVFRSWDWTVWSFPHEGIHLQTFDNRLGVRGQCKDWTFLLLSHVLPWVGLPLGTLTDTIGTLYRDWDRVLKGPLDEARWAYAGWLREAGIL